MSSRYARCAFGPVSLLAVLLAGCGETKPPDASARKPALPDALPAAMVLAAAPDGARDVADVKRDAKVSDEVVIHGVIGGSKSPFVPGRAVFTIVDPAVKSCAAMSSDHCPTPWDYCCEPPPNLAANSATIQLVGADGKPLKIDVSGTSGLKPLADVTIRGRVEVKQDAALVIAGTAFFVRR